MARNIKLPIGSDNFKKVVTTSDYFVDKSLFIQEIIDSSEDAILITRARRWGKSLNLDMLKTFLSIEVNKEGTSTQENSNKILFSGGKILIEQNKERVLEKLEIAKIRSGTFITEYQGKYPVVHISFKDVTGDSIEKIETKLKSVIKDLYKEFRYLESSSKLHVDEKSDFKKYIEQEYKYISLENSLKFLSELLSKHHDQMVYILVDEYDKPVNYLLEKKIEASQVDLIQKASELTTAILAKCGKGNPYLQKIVLAGVYDTLKKEGGSGFNNVKVHGVTDPAFVHSFGLSELEVEQLVDNIGTWDNSTVVKQILKDWYNGYTAPLYDGTYIRNYNPWAVMNYLNEAIQGKLEPENHWSKSGANPLFETLAHYFSDYDIIYKFSILAHGNATELRFDSQISLFDLSNAKKNEQVFSYLMLNAGYLTVSKFETKYLFKVPNNEVKSEFSRLVSSSLEMLWPDQNLDAAPTKKMLFKLNDELSGWNPVRKAIDMIISEDDQAIRSLFNHTLTKCEHTYVKVNLLHIGALSGNNNIMKFLLSHCESKLLSSADNAMKLKPIDYAYLSANKNTIQMLEDASPNDKQAITLPGWLQDITCRPFGLFYFVYGVIGVITITSVVKASPKIFGTIFSLGFLGVSIMSEMVITITRDILKNIASNKFGFCEEYDSYSNIDISAIKSANSLIQYEKYVLSHESTYVSAHEGCRENYKAISTLAVTHLIYDESKELVFTLCEHTGMIEFNS